MVPFVKSLLSIYFEDYQIVEETSRGCWPFEDHSYEFRASQIVRNIIADFDLIRRCSLALCQACFNSDLLSL